MRIVFFDLEEEGLLGSRHFVKSMKKDSVAGIINLDTLQGGDTLFYGPAAGVEHDKLNHTMRAVCAEPISPASSRRRSPRATTSAFTAAACRAFHWRSCRATMRITLADVERRDTPESTRLRAGSPADNSYAGGPAGEARSQGAGDCVQRRRGSAAPARRRSALSRLGGDLAQRLLEHLDGLSALDQVLVIDDD